MFKVELQDDVHTGQLIASVGEYLQIPFLCRELCMCRKHSKREVITPTSHSAPAQVECRLGGYVISGAIVWEERETLLWNWMRTWLLLASVAKVLQVKRISNAKF